MSNRKDAAWFTHFLGSSAFVETVSIGSRAINVFVDGEMRIEWLNAETAVTDKGIIRTASDLYNYNITTDEELEKAYDDGKICWFSNPWFDLYLPRGHQMKDEYHDEGHLSVVTHTLSDAFIAAFAILMDDNKWNDRESEMD